MEEGQLSASSRLAQPGDSICREVPGHARPFDPCFRDLGIGKTQCLFPFCPSPAPSLLNQQGNSQSFLQKPVGRMRLNPTPAVYKQADHMTLTSFPHRPHGHLHSPRCPYSLSTLGHFANGSTFVADPAWSPTLLPQLVLCPLPPAPQSPCKNTCSLSTPCSLAWAPSAGWHSQHPSTLSP